MANPTKVMSNGQKTRIQAFLSYKAKSISQRKVDLSPRMTFPDKTESANAESESSCGSKRFTSVFTEMTKLAVSKIRTKLNFRLIERGRIYATAELD